MDDGDGNPAVGTRVPNRMARRILAALLLAMAAGQLVDLTGFVDVVETYGLGDRTTAWLLAVPLVLGEIVGGVGLFLRGGPLRRAAPSVAVAVAVAWTVLGTQAFARGLALENCGCFGVHLAQPLRWWILVEDAEFIALGWWVRRKDVSGGGRRLAVAAGSEPSGELLQTGQ